MAKGETKAWSVMDKTNVCIAISDRATLFKETGKTTYKTLASADISTTKARS